MRNLLEENGLRALEALSFTRTLYAFDFDGTLARIVREPEDAGMTATTCSLFKTLVASVPVAVISGRSISDLKPRLACTPGYLVGNHGLEGLQVNSTPLDQASVACGRWRAQITASLSEKLAQGVEIEDKSLSLAVHYRKSRNKSEVRNAILAAAQGMVPTPRVIAGKCVVNLVPLGAPHKGIALMELMDLCGARSALYIGDDDTDEDVFALPDSRSSRIMSVRVGWKEASNANYFIDRQSDINRVLGKILGFHGLSPAVVKESLRATRA